LEGSQGALGIGAWAFTSLGTDVKGEIRARGKPFGDYVQKPSECYSGEHQNFFGVWVAPPIRTVKGREGFQGGLKLVKSELEVWNAYVESPIECEGLKCAIRPVDRATCSTFDVEVRNTNTSYNDIRVREGHAKLDCKIPNGGTLHVDLVFCGCS